MTKLGLLIEPSQVRLIPRSNDASAWQIVSEKEHLFQEHLSKHSIGVYGGLYQGVGVLFKAVLSVEPSRAPKGPYKDRREAKVRVSLVTKLHNGTIRVAISRQSSRLRGQALGTPSSHTVREALN